MDRKAAAKSQALQYEVELNEAVASAPKAAAAGAPPDGSVVAKCCAILDDMERASAFGPYQKVVSQLKGLLYQAVFSDGVTSDASGQLQRVPYATVVVEMGQVVDELEAAVKSHEADLGQYAERLAAAEAESTSLSKALSDTQGELDGWKSKHDRVLSDKQALQDAKEELEQDHAAHLRRVATDLADTKEEVSGAHAEAGRLRRYVDNQEANRKAFMDMQQHRRPVQPEGQPPGDLHDALTLENQIVLLQNMRIEQFEDAILDATEVTTARLRARFVQEMAVLYEELASIRKHIAQLGREEVIADVAKPVDSLTAGAGTVFRVEEDVSVSTDGGRTFERIPLAPNDVVPSLRDQFLQHSIFEVGPSLTERGAAISHVQVKLMRQHHTPVGDSKIPLSELPDSLGAGPLWDIYRRKNGHVKPKRPKGVSLSHLLRIIDEVYRCKAILEDDRESAQVPTMALLEDFFFEHMQLTYGEEWVALHVVHGIFTAVSKYRQAIPTVELFYQSINARKDDSGWRYIRQCRALLHEMLNGRTLHTMQQFRDFMSRLYGGASPIPEADLHTLETEFMVFASEYAADHRNTCSADADYVAMGDRVEHDAVEEDAVFEFLTQKILDGKERRYTKVRITSQPNSILPICRSRVGIEQEWTHHVRAQIRKKLIQNDVLNKNSLKLPDYMQFVAGYEPRVSSRPNIMLRAIPKKRFAALSNQAGMLAGTEKSGYHAFPWRHLDAAVPGTSRRGP
jgi:hypothetical protein